MNNLNFVKAIVISGIALALTPCVVFADSTTSSTTTTSTMPAKPSVSVDSSKTVETTVTPGDVVNKRVVEVPAETAMPETKQEPRKVMNKKVVKPAKVKIKETNTTTTKQTTPVAPVTESTSTTTTTNTEN